ncbi:MAG: hypothetical protein FWC85_01085 [Elusimicrobia bacterium]|nr:hypothetical protein [Elusimicrobiota bacterium]
MLKCYFFVFILLALAFTGGYVYANRATAHNFARENERYYKLRRRYELSLAKAWREFDGTRAGQLKTIARQQEAIASGRKYTTAMAEKIELSTSRAREVFEIINSLTRSN